MSLLQGKTRNATVIAKTSVIIYQINMDIIKSFVTQYPEFAIKLSESIMERHLGTETIKADGADGIDKLNKKEKIALDFLDSFKKFLGI